MNEHRTSVVCGGGPVVLRIANEYGFHEHRSVAEATAEAQRLAEQTGGEFVVYAPVASVVPAPKTVTTNLVSRDLLDLIREAEALDSAEMPF